MAMGTRKHRQRQEGLWYRSELPEAPGHPFYRRLNEVLEREGFDRFCEARCREFYHEKLGRPSLAPGTRLAGPRLAFQSPSRWGRCCFRCATALLGARLGCFSPLLDGDGVASVRAATVQRISIGFSP